MSNTIRTGLEQGRAKYAYDQVEKASTQLGKDAKEYKAYVKKMPMYIKVNGLGATMSFAFYKKRKNQAWALLYSDIEGWLKKDHKALIDFNDDELVASLIKEESATYRAVTIEVLALLTWLKRFADGLIEGEAENTD
ncbi:MAG: type III-B CRISPR module-associated protein Cmr5 [Chitinophagales bacterium]|nr:type III-B CRISPR module-associated protein Cmr5 [Chitinophagales bacterium]